MKELMHKIRRKHIIVLAGIIICGIVLLQLAPVVKAQTDGGQVIYDSTYIDKMEANLKQLIQSSSDELKKQISASSGTDLAQKLSDTEKELAALKESMVFTVIKLPAGKTLVGGNSTEIIVRTKNAVTAYVGKTASGGLSNLISGKDLQNGATVPDNQLLLVPKDDGRGIKAAKDAYIMIKGSYTIK